MASDLVSDEELQRRLRWQALVDWNLGAELWANLPAEMTPTLEDAARELWSRPIHFPRYSLYEHRVFPAPTQTNLVRGAVRRMQRVVLLAI